jgi:hypothetical protein
VFVHKIDIIRENVYLKINKKKAQAHSIKDKVQLRIWRNNINPEKETNLTFLKI